VRMLSLLAGTITVFFGYLLARELFSHRLATIAALFLALAPFPVHYSQEIRMYSFLAMWLTIATYAYLRGSRDKTWGWWVLFSVAAVLAQYTHNLAAFYLIPLAITPILHRDRKTLLSVVLGGAGAFVLYLPWFIQLPSQFNKVYNSYWVARPGFAKLFTLLLTYVTNLPLPGGWLFPALFIALAVFSIGLIQTFRASNRNASGLWLLYLSFAPPIFLFLFSQWVPVYIERALLPSGVIFCIWLAWSLFDTALPIVLRNSLLGLLATGAIVGLFQHITYRDFPYAPYQALDMSLRARIEPNDIIVHSNKLSLLPAIYFDRMLPQLFIADPPGSSTDTLAEATRVVLGVTAAPNMEIAVKGANRIWFVIFDRSIEESQSLGLETHPHLEYLYRKFTEISDEHWGGLRIYLFEKVQ